MHACAGQESRQRCELALELLGERNEAVEQLQEDIADMRAIFHAQLGLMADQLAAAQADAHA
jgi:hypothetical protein